MKREANERSRDTERSHDNDVQLSPLEKDGEKLIAALEEGHMVAILSQLEILYVILDSGYRCYIHPIGAEEGRAKRLPRTGECRAVVKNLANLADQIFVAKFKKGMDIMGVMEAAENGIVAFLDATGQLPAEDCDFMQWKDAPAQEETQTV